MEKPYQTLADLENSEKIRRKMRLDDARAEAVAGAAHALGTGAVPIDARDQMNMAQAIVRALVYVGDCIRAHGKLLVIVGLLWGAPAARAEKIEVALLPPEVAAAAAAIEAEVKDAEAALFLARGKMHTLVREQQNQYFPWCSDYADCSCRIQVDSDGDAILVLRSLY